MVNKESCAVYKSLKIICGCLMPGKYFVNIEKVKLSYQLQCMCMCSLDLVKLAGFVHL